MKKIFFLAIVVFLFLGCKKLKKSYNGEVTFLINGNPYKGELFTKDEGSTFDFGLSNKINGINHDNFSFSWNRKTMLIQTVKKRTPGPGISLFPICAYGTVQDDGDVACELFQVYEPDSVNNYIQITKEENNYKELWGVFNVTLYKTDSCIEKNSGSILHCTEGKFHLLLE